MSDRDERIAKLPMWALADLYEIAQKGAQFASIPHGRMKAGTALAEARRAYEALERECPNTPVRARI